MWSLAKRQWIIMGLAVPTENMIPLTRRKGQIHSVTLPPLAASANNETKPKFPFIYIEIFCLFSPLALPTHFVLHNFPRFICWVNSKKKRRSPSLWANWQVDIATSRICQHCQRSLQTLVNCRKNQRQVSNVLAYVWESLLFYVPECDEYGLFLLSCRKGFLQYRVLPKAKSLCFLGDPWESWRFFEWQLS